MERVRPPSSKAKGRREQIDEISLHLEFYSAFQFNFQKAYEVYIEIFALVNTTSYFTM